MAQSFGIQREGRKRGRESSQPIKTLEDLSAHSKTPQKSFYTFRTSHSFRRVYDCSKTQFIGDIGAASTFSLEMSLVKDWKEGAATRALTIAESMSPEIRQTLVTNEFISNEEWQENSPHLVGLRPAVLVGFLNRHDYEGIISEMNHLHYNLDVGM